MTARPERHAPAMLREVVAAIAPRKGGSYVDATFGAGGYSKGILDAEKTCTVLGIDRDPAAIARGERLQRDYPGRLATIAGRFGDMERLLGARGVTRIDGVTFDLGVSSPQIDDPARGFSFMRDGPLDMRMSSEGPSAADLVDALSEDELADIVFRFGEERRSRSIARAIVRARAERPIARTGELAEIVRRAVPRSRDGVDPATRTFQALRIAVNDELGELDRGLAAAERLLAPGGRLAVVSFHSLEDRAVKRFLRERSGKADPGSRHRPGGVEARRAAFRLLTRRPLRPSPTECAANPRARSARLRAAERLA